MILLIFAQISIHGNPCTSAIVSGRLTPSGKPILWKNRDTSAIDNKVEYIPAALPGELAYVGLFNANDKKCEQAWIGLNEAGFAVMNTASYNLKDDNVPSSKMDREGYVMAHALKHCTTVDDFATLLEELPKPLGVEANFGVIDAVGNGAYFECNNHDYTRYDLKDEEDGVLVRTNYSHSGRKGEGYGQIRERNAEHLLKPYILAGVIEPYTLTDILSCSFYHDLYGQDMSTCGEQYLIDQDFIPRYTTTATVAIEDGVMWTALGYPPVAEVIPVWCAPDGVADDLRGLQQGGTSQACNLAKARKSHVFNVKDGNKDRYVNLNMLIQPDGNGYMQVFRRQNRRIYDSFHR
ncbi:MAG: C45 family peptidase [Muribaculaceae bacterium]|nr:C45 family peptidase [Muribaculaceae bacterium]